MGSGLRQGSVPVDPDLIRSKALGCCASKKPSFIRTEHVYGPEPNQNRCPGPVHHGAGRQRGLVAAIPALIQFSLGNKIVFVLSTARTNKALRPTKLKKPLLTILFGLIFLLGLKKVYFLIWLFHMAISFLLYIVFHKFIATIYSIS